jgi:hypothetical protein
LIWTEVLSDSSLKQRGDIGGVLSSEAISIVKRSKVLREMLESNCLLWIKITGRELRERNEVGGGMAGGVRTLKGKKNR